MSIQWTHFPWEIVFKIIESIDDRDDLLALALTCRKLCEMIIPNYLQYFRISTTMINTYPWDYVSENVSSCKNIRELELRDDTAQPRDGGHTYTSSKATLPTNPSVHDFLPYMVNMKCVKFLCFDCCLEPLDKAMEALERSKCTLEEIDLAMNLNLDSSDTDDEITTPSIEIEEITIAFTELPIWTKFDLSSLRKLAIRLGMDTPLLLNSGEVTCINSMLLNSPALTHLNITIDDTPISFVNLFGYTWPNLENLVVDSPTEALMDTTPSPSKIMDFFKRHPKLSRLSLISSIISNPSSTYITVECLPRLESLSYNERCVIRVPLERALSPASARRLRHLTIGGVNASLLQYSNMDIYKELTSLQSCRIISGSFFPHDESYENVDQILNFLVKHAPDLQKIHIPPYGGDFRQKQLVRTLSVLQCFPNLTQISGIWLGDISPNGPEWQMIIRKLHPLYQLEYITPILYQLDPINANAVQLARIFRLIRNGENLPVDVKPEVQNTISDCRLPHNWGSFYGGMGKFSSSG